MLEDDDAQEQAEFGAAFAGTEPPKPKDKTPEQQTETPPAKVEIIEPKYVQISETEWNEVRAAAAKTASYDKQFATMFGTLGGVKSSVDALKAQPRGETIAISNAAFDKLKEQFPEIADLTREAVQNALAGVHVKGAPELDESKISQVAAKLVSDREMEDLIETYPDWVSRVGAAKPGEHDPAHPFRAWLATKEAAYQERVTTTESGAVLKRAIDRFQRETRVTAKPKPTPPPRDEARREQLRAAVQPKGDGAPATSSKSDNDDFVAGFNPR